MADTAKFHGDFERRATPHGSAYVPRLQGGWRIAFTTRELPDGLAALAGALGFAGPALRPRQVHGRTVLSVPEDWDGTGEPPATDGLLTAIAATTLAVSAADCVPIVLAATRAVAVVHAGWRGTIAEIAPCAVAGLGPGRGIAAAELSAWLGPAIGSCCYEVGSEISEKFRQRFPHYSGVVRERAASIRLDLQLANALLLVEAGVPPANIHVLALCTRCHPEQLHSYRRDGAAAGRQFGLASLP